MTDNKHIIGALTALLKMALDQKEAHGALTQLVVDKLPGISAADKAALRGAYAVSSNDIKKIRALIEQMEKS